MAGLPNTHNSCWLNTILNLLQTIPTIAQLCGYVTARISHSIYSDLHTVFQRRASETDLRRALAKIRESVSQHASALQKDVPLEQQLEHPENRSADIDEGLKYLIDMCPLLLPHVQHSAKGVSWCNRCGHAHQGHPLVFTSFAVAILPDRVMTMQEALDNCHDINGVSSAKCQACGHEGRTHLLM